MCFAGVVSVHKIGFVKKFWKPKKLKIYGFLKFEKIDLKNWSNRIIWIIRKKFATPVAGWILIKIVSGQGSLKKSTVTTDLTVREEIVCLNLQARFCKTHPADFIGCNRAIQINSWFPNMEIKDRFTQCLGFFFRWVASKALALGAAGNAPTLFGRIPGGILELNETRTNPES